MYCVCSIDLYCVCVVFLPRTDIPGYVQINFSDVFGNPDSEKRMLLPQLVQCEATSVALIKDFCRYTG